VGAVRIDISQETYERLEEQARRAGKTPESFTRELVETALDAQVQAQPKTTLEALQAAGRIRPLSDDMRRRIIPGVTLNEVRAAMTEAAGSSLSEIILEQRGPKS
jgi:hypothetical protein